MDEQAVNMVNELIAKARVAQKQFESFSQEKPDAAVRAIGKVVYDRAEELAKMACEESGMGVYADKVAKCHGKSKCIWNSLKGKKSVGIIGEDKQTGIIRVAKAKGVVGSVTPVTNPVVTPMCNAMIALKGQNAIIVAPHRKAQKTNKYVIDLFRAELKKLGREDIIVIVGGVIPAQDYDQLYKDGAAAIFGPGTPIATAAIKMLEILLAD